MCLPAERDPPDEDDWPASDYDIAPIIKSFPDLVSDIYSNTLIDLLLQAKCLSVEQRKAVLGKETEAQMNRELLGIMMRRSVKQLRIFFKCLENDHAEILEQSKGK